MLKMIIVDTAVAVGIACCTHGHKTLSVTWPASVWITALWGYTYTFPVSSIIQRVLQAAWK